MYIYVIYIKNSNRLVIKNQKLNFMDEKLFGLDSVLMIGKKAWQKAGFNLFSLLNEEERLAMIEAINAPDPFFEGRVKDNQVLLYIPCLDESDNFSIRWWQNILNINQLPLSLQFTDMYNVSYCFNHTRVEPGWYLFTNKILPGSKEKPLKEQRQVLKGKYRDPNVHELVTFFTLSHLNGIDLERGIFGRSTVDLYGLSFVVSPAIYNRVNILREISEKVPKFNVGMYACKKIL